MFVAILTYLVPISEVDRHLEAHRAWLEQGYEAEVLLAAGPQVPRTGGVILALGSDRAAIEALFARDPFVIHGVARYEIVAFTVRSVDPRLAFLREA